MKVHAKRFTVAVSIALGVAMFLGQGQALATPTPVVLEQHWELLAATNTYARTTFIDIYRGTLPGGTAKFDPAPTVTFEVVGQHAGGLGTSHYDVSLYGTSATVPLATVPFTPNSAYRLMTASFAWPSGDQNLKMIKVTKVDSGLNVSGTFTLTKAYLKIHQSGVIKKTVSRLPIAVAQTGVTNLAWANVLDPVMFKYHAADFDPAPTIKFRTTGYEHTPVVTSFHPQLADSAGNGVTNSDHIHYDAVTSVSSTVTLADDEVYHAQVKVDMPGETGDLYSADLQFEQETSDAKGITKTVGFYPSVTTVANITGNATYLNGLFNNPQNSTPNAVVSYWDTSIKTSAGTVRADLYNGSALVVQGSGNSLASVESFDLGAADIGADMPDEPVGLDTRTVTTSGGTGRLSSSVLRQLLTLRDTVGPAISGLTVSVQVFNPSRGNASISAYACDFSEVTWTITIKNSSGQTVRTVSGTGNPGWSAPWRGTCSTPLHPSFSWDGKDTAGSLVADDNYSVTVNATDFDGNAAYAALTSTVRVDTHAPTIASFASTLSNFSPNGDGTKDAVTYTAGLTDPTTPMTWSIAIRRNGAGTPVRSLTGSGAAVSAIWDGKDSSGVQVIDGSYSAILTATDGIANVGDSGAVVVISDVTAPTVAGSASPTPFSPDGNGTKDTTTISGTLVDASAPLSWSMAIRRNGTGDPVRTFTGTGTTFSNVWDGNNDAGTLVALNGNYVATMTATDDVGNVGPTPITFIVDLVAPTIYSFAASNPSFSPNADGSKDTTNITAGLLDSSTPIAWALAIKDSSGATVRTYSASATSSISQSWNGKDTNGLVVPDGLYTAVLTATDTQLLTRTSSDLAITVDTVLPTIADFTVTPNNPARISPTTNGVPNTATFASTSVSDDRSASLSWTVAINNSASGNVRSYSGTAANAGAVSQVWDGKSSGMFPSVVPDGSYTSVLSAADAAGNRSVRSTSVIVDTLAPSISGFGVSEGAFSPNGDAVKDTTTIAASLADDWSPQTWTIEIKSSSGSLKRSISGSGTSISQTWDGKDDGGIVLPDGIYTAFLSALDGGLNVRVTSKTIMLDTQAPTLLSIVPGDHGNTVFRNQTIDAHVSDALAGVDDSPLSISVTDQTTNTGIPVLSISGGQSSIRGNIVTVAGHDYSVLLEATDKAGNVGHIATIFNALQLDVPGAHAKIPDTNASSVQSPSPGTTVLTFTDVPVRLNRYAVHATGISAHPGIGVVDQLIDLSQARIRLYKTVAGQDVLVGDVPAPSNWPRRQVHQQLATLGNSYLHPLAVRAMELRATMTVTVALPADKAIVYMDTTSAPSQPYCADPSTGCEATQFASPDPFMFYVGETDAVSLATQLQSRLEATLVELAAEGQTQQTGDETDMGMLYELGNAITYWEQVKVGSPHPNLIPPPIRASNYPEHFPQTFSGDCQLSLCAHAGTPGVSYSSPPLSDGRCLGDFGKPWPCRQWVIIHAFEANVCHGCRPGGRDANHFEADVVLSFGVEESDHDDLGWSFQAPLASFASDSKMADRAYVQNKAQDSNSCQAVADVWNADYVNDGSDNAWVESSTSAMYKEGTLAQKRGNQRCWNYLNESLVPRRLAGAAVKHTLRSYATGLETIFIASYGHNYNTWTHSWSCGGGIPWSIGCYFSPAETKEAWKIQDIQNFSY